MSSRIIIPLKDIVIANGAQIGNEISVVAEAVTITIFCPATITNTCKVQVSADDGLAADVTWYDLRSSGADITMTVDDAITITASGFRQMRLRTVVNESQQDTFVVRAQAEI